MSRKIVKQVTLNCNQVNASQNLRKHANKNAPFSLSYVELFFIRQLVTRQKHAIQLGLLYIGGMISC